VNIDDKKYSVDNSNLIKNYDIDSLVEEAFAFGKETNIIEKHKMIKNGSNKNFDLNFTFDDEYINAFTMNIEKEINKDPVNATIEIKDENMININTDIKGYKLEKEKLGENIQEELKNGSSEDTYITASAQSIEAAITQEELSDMDNCIASFRTNFQSSSFARTNNIDISIKAINGKVLKQGEIFSFNDAVGERTDERGYMEAPVIIGNAIQLALGGGICQVSSTLYNAILIAGLQPTERISHSLPISYVDNGFDATVDWGNIDFKFKNTLDYPVYIEGHTENKYLYINIFSKASVNKNVYKSLSKTS
jgi:vancomycin resistance protein YoaR